MVFGGLVDAQRSEWYQEVLGVESLKMVVEAVAVVKWSPSLIDLRKGRRL